MDDPGGAEGVFSSTTCEDIEALIRDVNASYYESLNMTHDAFVASLRTPHCTPKPYLGMQGAKKWTTLIILVAFLLFGLIGNLLSATIMFRRARRGLSSYFYLGLLAIVDICVMYTGCLLFMLEVAFDYHPQLGGPFQCRVGFYVQHLFTYVSAWLIVAVTFERFVVVRFPFQSIRICRLHVAYAISSIIVLFFALFTLHGFFTMDIVRSPLQTDDGYHPDYLVCDLVVSPRLLAFVDLCLYSVVPSALIMIFNLLIISTMFHAIKQRNCLQASSGPQTTDKNKSSSSMRTPFFRSRSVESSPAARTFIPHGQRNPPLNKSPHGLCDSTSVTGIRLTCLLLLLSFIFVLCTMPISIRLLVADFLPGHKSTSRWQLVHLILNLLMYLNHAINVVLYCLTGRAFRRECRKLLGGLCVLKDLHVSCAMNPRAKKQQQQQPYHHPLALTGRYRMVLLPSQQQQQRMKRSCL